ncbi:hypothetical protein [Sphingobacterium siyangense]|uniref:hypothetical protein n=1 Tax=Sphingobacterium siyangense TaxID=459529 RepID=UPI0028AD1B0A|nr:hypothetical protein [Sphingobacterium siyangense]
MEEFKIGDEVFHKADSTQKWVIEKIDDEKVLCSTLIKETLKQVKETFLKTSIKKCADRSITFGNSNRRNHRF